MQQDVGAAGGFAVVAAAAEFVAARQAGKPSPHTVRAYERDLQAVLGYAATVVGRDPEEVGLGELSTAVMRRAFAGFAESRAASSVLRAWSTWNQFFGFLVAEGRVQGNPMSGVSRPRVQRCEPKPLVGEDTPERLVEAVAAGCRRARDPWPERDVAVVALALVTGLRSAELLTLRVDSLGGRAGERRLRVLGKGDRVRWVPVEQPLEAVVQAYLVSRESRFGVVLQGSDALLVDRRGQALRRGGLQYLVRQCYRYAGVGDRVARGALVHALRHTFATRLAEDGASVTEIMRLLGHSSVVSAQAYIGVTAQAQRAAAGANRTYGVVRRVAGTSEEDAD